MATVRVTINAGGREVTIECADSNTTPKDVAAEALATWMATAGATSPTQGPAHGFVAAERSTPANGRYLGEGKPQPVHAETP